MFLEDLSDKVRRGIECSPAGPERRRPDLRLLPGTDERGTQEGAPAVREIEAAVMRGIFRDWAAGLSAIKIASQLNDEGIRSPSFGTKRKS